MEISEDVTEDHEWGQVRMLIKVEQQGVGALTSYSFYEGDKNLRKQAGHLYALSEIEVLSVWLTSEANSETIFCIH